MKSPTKLLRLRPALVALFGVAALAGCTPEQVALFDQVTGSYREVVSDEQLHRLRVCESHDNYAAVSATGRYRGAYQFSQSTWNRVATAHFPWLKGVDPATVEFYWQDSMARALWSESGASPWPHCGSKV